MYKSKNEIEIRQAAKITNLENFKNLRKAKKEIVSKKLTEINKLITHYNALCALINDAKQCKFYIDSLNNIDIEIDFQVIQLQLLVDEFINSKIA